MGHDKLRKFAENESFSCLLQPSSRELLADGYFALRDHEIKGRWAEKMFGAEPLEALSASGDKALSACTAGQSADKPLVLELGCGKGEYTIALAQRNPGANYIGVDIKGARLWKGAKFATEHKMPNVAFLRTRIEFISAFFAPNEVSQIWLTFSDPQFRSPNSRLTSPLFLERYRSFMRPGGIVHLKTDSRFLHEYTKSVCEANGLKILACTSDLYSLTAAPAANTQAQNDEAQPGSSSLAAAQSKDTPSLYLAPDFALPGETTAVQTFYENLFLEQGYKITYLAFQIDHEGAFTAPTSFDSEYWRSVEGPRLLFGHDSAETRRQKLKLQADS